MMPADRDGIAAAARMLAAGGLVAFPTETVYGLGADATNGAAVARLYAAKGRPRFNPLIVHVPDARRGARARALFRRREEARGGVLAGPADAGAAEARRLPGRRSWQPRGSTPSRCACRRIRSRAICSRRSAGRWSRPPPTGPATCRRRTPRMCCADLGGRIELILDGGPTSVGIESTIVACLDGPTCCGRAGCRARRSSACSGQRCSKPSSGRGRGAARAGHAGLALRAEGAAAARRDEMCSPAKRCSPSGRLPPRARQRCSTLCPRGDLVEAAANLFAHLRALDAAGATTIAVMPIPNEDWAKRSTTGWPAPRASTLSRGR